MNAGMEELVIQKTEMQDARAPPYILENIVKCHKVGNTITFISGIDNYIYQQQQQSEEYQKYSDLYLVPTFLVVNENGVAGRYTDIEEAKQKLKSNGGRIRLIAEVNDRGELNRDPHLVGGQNQGIGIKAGFDKHWRGWNDIDMLIETCFLYLHPTGKLKQISKCHESINTHI